MSKVIELKQRVDSVTKVGSAANAMQVAAAAQLKGIQLNQKAAWHFKKHYLRLAASLRIDRAYPPPEQAEPLVRVYLLTSKLGFCGGFNEQVVRAAERYLAGQSAKGKKTCLTVIGRKGCELCCSRLQADEQKLVPEYSTGDFASLTEEGFASYRLWRTGAIERVVFIFNEYFSMLVQKPKVLTLLPFGLSGVEQEAGEPIIDLPEHLVLEHVAANYVRTMFYDAYMQTLLGALGSRLLTMRGAAENSKEMLKTLSIQLNKARQSMITIELSEIISAFESLGQEVG